MDISRLLNTPPRRRLPSEIPETPLPPPPPIPLSQLSTQSWDSRNGPRPSRESSFTSGSSQMIPLPQTPQKQYTRPTTRSDRIRIKTALDFNISPASIYKKYSYTEKQIRLAKQHLTPQKNRCGRKPKVNTPTRH